MIEYLIVPGGIHFGWAVHARFNPKLGTEITNCSGGIFTGLNMLSEDPHPWRDLTFMPPNLMYKIKLLLGLAKPSKEDIFEDIEIKDSDIENKSSSER